MSGSKSTKKRSPNNIGAVRRFRGIKQKEAAQALGVSASTYAHWEQGINAPSTSAIARMREYYRVTADQLLIPGYPLPGEVSSPVRRAPIVGRIAAGDPREAIEQADNSQYVFNPEASDEAFYLVCAGDSMSRVIPQGMLVLIDPEKEVRSGEVAAVMINGDDATLKRVIFAGNTVVLHPESDNPTYRDIAISIGDRLAPEFRIIGPVIGICSPPGWRA